VPFPDSGLDSAYDKAEEVSLEQLLSEGRERPATIGGNVAIPVMPISDDVEELGAEELVEEPPIAVAIAEEPVPVMIGGDGRAEELEVRVRDLEEQVASLRAEHRAGLERILRELNNLPPTVRSQL